MRSIIGEALSDARTRGASVVRAPFSNSLGLGSGGGNPLALTSGSQGMGVGRQPTLQHHTEQLRHYTGWVHASIQPVAKRVARQPLRIAVVKDQAVPQGDTPGAPPAPTIPGSRKGYVARRPWQHTAVDAETLAKHLWFKRVLPGAQKAYYETAEILDHHPVLDAVENPNEIMVRWSMIFVTVACLMLTGKAYWWVRAKEREGDGENERGPAGIEIWPVPPNWVQAVHTEKKLYDHWELKPDGVTEPFEVPTEQIIYFSLPDPANMLGAVGVLQAQSRAVVADESIAEAQRRGFANGLFPGVAVVVGRQPDVNGAPGERPALNKEQRAQIVTAFKQAYRGVYNMDEPVILDRIIEDVKRITNTNRDMDFMESGKYTKDRITQGFGTNPIVMGQVEGANRSSSATADDHLCQSTVNPIIELISEVLSKWMNKLFGRPGQRILVFLEEAHAIDPDSERADWDLLMRVGAASRDELRAALKGLPPIRDGEQCLVPAGMAPVDCTRRSGGANVSGVAPVRSSAIDAFDPVMAARDVALNVPDVRQATPYDCGAAATRAVAEYRGVAEGDEDDFIWTLKTSDVTGTLPRHVANYFRNHGCQTIAQDNLTVDRLRRYVVQGWPVLVVMQYVGEDSDQADAQGGDESAGHWVVVTGFTEDGVRVMCPLDGHKVIPNVVFVQNWHDRAVDGTSYKRFGIAVGMAPRQLAHGPDGQKVRDREGHEHAADGRFGSGGGGGKPKPAGADRPPAGGDKPKPAEHPKVTDHKPDESKPQPGERPKDKPDTGKTTDPPAKHEERAKGFMAKIAEAGAKAVGAAKAAGERMKHAAYNATWAVASGKVKADDILDTTHDYAKIINDKGMCAHLGLPMSGGAIAAIGSHILAFGVTKAKAAIAARREAKTWDDAWYKGALTEDELREKAEAVHAVLVDLLSAGLNAPDEALPSLDDVLAYVQAQEPSADEGDDSADGDKRFVAPALVMDRAHRVEIRVKAIDSAEAELADVLAAHFEDERQRMLKLIPDVVAGLKGVKVKPVKDSPGDEPDADDLEEDGIGGALDRLCPLSGMTLRLRRAVAPALEGIAVEAASAEHDELVPTQKFELARRGFTVGYWTRGRKPKVDRKPLPKVIREKVNEALDVMVNDPYWNGISKTTRLKMARAVRRGIARGEDAGEIEDRITAALSGVMDRGRAIMIARTEATAAVNLGAQAAREKVPAGVVAGKEWVATDDQDTRNTHRAADGQVRKVNSKFRVGSQWCSYPGDPALPPEERCQCRCVSMSVPAN